MTESRQTLDLYMRCPLELWTSSGEKKKNNTDKALSFNPAH